MLDIGTLVKQHAASVVELRRYFHMYPELSGQEYNTQKKILTQLEQLGVTGRAAAKTGVIADIKGNADGPIVAVRADIDALKLTDECEQPYRSVNHGVCHACGHDGHTAMALGIAQLLAELKGSFAGTVRLLFQPSEEQFPGGAQAMIEDGALAGVSAVIAAHLWQPLPVGTVGISYGRLMAAPDSFTITVQGQGGHGSMPQQTVDPILVGAQIVVALNTIVGRNINPLESAVVSLGQFKSGEVFNVIPDTATIMGTVRSFDHALRLRIFERIEAIAQGIGQAAGASCIVDKHFGFPPLVNDKAVAEIVAAAAGDVVPEQGVLTIPASMAAEDFSYYLEKAPGMMMFVGCGNVDRDIVYPHHHPKFDIDEAALAVGTEVMLRAALKLLQQ